MTNEASFSTDYREDQENELETLRCIYTEEELTEITKSPPCFQVSVQSSDDNHSSGYSTYSKFTSLGLTLSAQLHLFKSALSILCL